MTLVMMMMTLAAAVAMVAMIRFMITRLV